MGPFKSFVNAMNERSKALRDKLSEDGKAKMDAFEKLQGSLDKYRGAIKERWTSSWR